MLTHEEVTAEVRSAVMVWLESLDSHLIGPATGFLQRRRFFELPHEAFSDELGYPVLGLPLWSAEALETTSSRPLPESAVVDICTAAVYGYLHTRVIDDHLDERLGGTAETIAVSNVLLAKANELLAQHVGSDRRFWAYHRDRITRASAALVAEISAGSDRDHTEDHFRVLLDRAAPLTIPAAAVMSRGNSWHLLEPLEAFAGSISWASQMLNDLRDVGKDLTHDRVTWAAVRIMTPEPGGTIPNVSERNRIYREVESNFAQAAQLAHGMGLVGGQAWSEAAQKRIAVLATRAESEV